jgi:CRP-like cAMP-binding protein
MGTGGNLPNNRPFHAGGTTTGAATGAPDASRSRFLPRLGRLGLPDEMTADLLNETIVVPYGRNFRPFLQGAPADVLMLVLNGVVKVYCAPNNSRRFLLQLAGPGDLIGYADFVDDKGRRIQIFESEALTNCTVALIFRHRVIKRLQGLDSAGLVTLLEQANTFWSWVTYRYASLLSFSYRERLEIVLSEVAARFGIRDARGTMLALELGHEDWAEMIGCSRPMASRLFADLVRAQILSRDGKRYIILNGTEVAGRRSLLPGAGAETGSSLRTQ